MSNADLGVPSSLVEAKPHVYTAQEQERQAEFVREVQQIYGLPVTGIPGPQERALLSQIGEGR